MGVAGHRDRLVEGDGELNAFALAVGVGGGGGRRGHGDGHHLWTRADAVIGLGAKLVVHQLGVVPAGGADGVVGIQHQGLRAVADPDAVVIFVGAQHGVGEDHRCAAAGIGVIGGLDQTGSARVAQRELEVRIARHGHRLSERHGDLDDLSRPVPRSERGGGDFDRLDGGKIDQVIRGIGQCVVVECRVDGRAGSLDGAAQGVGVHRHAIAVEVRGHYGVGEHQLRGGALRGLIGGVAGVAADVQLQLRAARHRDGFAEGDAQLDGVSRLVTAGRRGAGDLEAGDVRAVADEGAPDAYGQGFAIAYVVVSIFVCDGPMRGAVVVFPVGVDLIEGNGVVKPHAEEVVGFGLQNGAGRRLEGGVAGDAGGWEDKREQLGSWPVVAADAVNLGVHVAAARRVVGRRVEADGYGFDLVSVGVVAGREPLCVNASFFPEAGGGLREIADQRVSRAPYRCGGVAGDGFREAAVVGKGDRAP